MIDDDDDDNDDDDVLEQSPHAYLANTFIGHYSLLIFIYSVIGVDTNHVDK